MRIAVTGATGFVGGHLLPRLTEAGHLVSALTRRPQPDLPGVTWVNGALNDARSLAHLCLGCDAVVHVAGVVNAPDAAAFDAGNRVGTCAVLQAATAAGAIRFVHISSLAAREPELSMYGASKRAAEDAVANSDLDWRIVRPTAIYGPGDTGMLDIFRMASHGVVALPPAGRMSVIHVDDFVRLVLALVESPEGGVLYEADDGVPGGWAHRDFAATLGTAVGRKVIALPMPKALLSLASRLDRLFRGAKASLTADRVDYLTHPDWTIDPDRGVPAALWTPHIATPAGLQATAAWYRANGWL
ncbi:NAD(P)-dependent oxidoreductase [Sphingomonas sp.]|uniref:NAD-dependent epimerase/dehydratase family protein n=1 Tax=Sphingomonas sp. TaxID=28214 RepID=UPI0025DACD33|nr:NAD-dependent epimerase/dehydratase family protein [Sphingomonas sp.]